MITDEVKEAFVLDLMKKNLRADGRGMLDYRQIGVDKNVYENCEGSAVAHIGDTKVVAGVKIDLATPFADRPTEGVIMFNAEFSPVAHPEFTAGPPDERSIELARVVDRGIRSAECIDLDKLFLEEEKVLGVYVDLFIVDHNGNLTDTAYLASMAALRGTKVPKYEDGKLVREERTAQLPIARDVVSCTFEKVGDRILLDGREEEEVSSSGRVTFATCGDDLLCASQKSGRAGFGRAEFESMIDTSLAKRRELLKHI
jgi:exosome complex component RRP42